MERRAPAVGEKRRIPCPMRPVNLDHYKSLLARYRYWVMGIVVLSPLMVLAASSIGNPSYLATRTVTWVEGVPKVALNKFWKDAQVQVEADKMPIALEALTIDSKKHYVKQYPGHVMLPAQLVLEHPAHSNRVEIRFSDTDPERAKAMADAVAGQIIRYVETAEKFQKQKVLDTLQSHIRLSRKSVETLDQKLRQQAPPAAPPPQAAKPPAPHAAEAAPPAAANWNNVLAYATEQSRIVALNETEQPLINELKFQKPQDGALWAQAMLKPEIAQQVEAYRQVQKNLQTLQETNPPDKEALGKAETEALKLEQSMNGELSKLWPNTNATTRQQMVVQLAVLTDRQALMLRILARVHQQYTQAQLTLARLPHPGVIVPTSQNSGAAQIHAPGDGSASLPADQLLKQRDKVLRQQVFYEAQYLMLSDYLAHLPPHVVSKEEAKLIPSPGQIMMMILALLSMPVSGVLMLVFLNFWSKRPKQVPFDIASALNLPLIESIPTDKMVQHRSKGKGYSPVSGLQSTQIPLILDLPMCDVKAPLQKIAQQINETASSGNKTFSIISPRSQSGTTFLVANIATLLARSGKKTLLIDGNLKNPELHEVFDLPEIPGFMELLAGKANIKEVLKHIERFGPLLVMPVGKIPTDPVQMLMHPELDGVMTSLKKYFDIILFNTPSDIQTPETIALARLSGQTLLNLREADANPKNLKKWQRIFEELPGKKLGVLLNFKRTSESSISE